MSVYRDSTVPPVTLPVRCPFYRSTSDPAGQVSVYRDSTVPPVIPVDQVSVYRESTVSTDDVSRSGVRLQGIKRFAGDTYRSGVRLRWYHLAQ